MAFNPATVPVAPITSLSPFMGGQQWIKARVVDKGDVRTWNKPNSTGKLFSCTLVDETASIRCTFFNEGVDLFYNTLNNGQVYYICGGSVKNANRRFSNVNNEYELTMDKDAQIHPARDAAANIPMQRYNFIPVSGIAKKEKNSICDIIVVVIKNGETGKIVAKSTGNEMSKKDLVVSDSSGAIEVAVWNDDIMKLPTNLHEGMVVALKNVRVSDWNTVSLTFGKDSTVDVEPAIEDTNTLKRWYQSGGGAGAPMLSKSRMAEGGASASFKGRCMFADIETMNLGHGEKSDVIEVRCTPSFIKTEQVWYDACPVTNRKVSMGHDNTYFCERCNKAVVPVARYMCSIQASDGVNTKWLTIFNEAGEDFWGCTAQALKDEAQHNPKAVAERAQARLHKPLVLTIRVKEDRGRTMPDGTPLEDRMNLTVSGVKDFFYPAKGAKEEMRVLIDAIKAYHF